MEDVFEGFIKLNGRKTKTDVYLRKDLGIVDFLELVECGRYSGANIGLRSGLHISVKERPEEILELLR